MHKTVRMSTDKCKSLHFYKYLCQKIGFKEDVKIGRLTSTILGEAQSLIVSGSKGEGLYFKSSDLDLMYVDPLFKVYESETEVILNHVNGGPVPLVMDTEMTQPCFTQLCLPNHYNNALPRTYKNIFKKGHLGCMLSSEQYNLSLLSIFSKEKINYKIHGPCVTDGTDCVDSAFCLKCDKWIFQAQPWVRRSRTIWPPSEIISKIIKCGTLFVPIGYKGSVNEHLEWRISFSVAERFLIFSFSHTQLLCYALLKILLKEKVEKHEDLKGLLCSYFLKTLMFWISEETDINSWRADNIIPCFLSCLQRLLYCVRSLILPHYFIPDNNLFYTRFNVMNKEKLIIILENIYNQGINCFVSSETLQYYQTQSYNIYESLPSGNFRLFLEHLLFVADKKCTCPTNICVLYNFVQYSSSGLSRGLLAIQFSKACRFAPDASKHCYSSTNKQQYLKYKYDLSHLLIGVNSDAVSGWLTLASFFYGHNNYFASFRVINYTLQKYIDEKTKTTSCILENKFNYFQKYVLHMNLLKKENLFIACRTLKIYPLNFRKRSSIIPQELQLDVTNESIMYNPQGFGHFLRFLCNYHLHDITSCRYYLQNLLSTIVDAVANSHGKEDCMHCLRLVIFSAIGHQLLGETNVARRQFQIVADMDYLNLTSAASRSKLLG